MTEDRELHGDCRVRLQRGILHVGRACAGEQALRLREQDAPGQVRVAGLVRGQLQRVQEGGCAARWQVSRRVHSPCQILGHPAAPCKV